jgi:hypothetical protein
VSCMWVGGALSFEFEQVRWLWRLYVVEIGCCGVGGLKLSEMDNE